MAAAQSPYLLYREMMEYYLIVPSSISVEAYYNEVKQEIEGNPAQ
jgi:hypothetical protein